MEIDAQVSSQLQAEEQARNQQVNTDHSNPHHNDISQSRDTYNPQSCNNQACGNSPKRKNRQQDVLPEHANYLKLNN